uniref:anthranilate phosphoribosyltransferase n=1 Tax=Arcella intermedia TaxID=1963864 RepID=A0A6B2L8K0_9EUKA
MDNSIRRCIKFLVETETTKEEVPSELIVSCIQEIMTGAASASQIGAFLVALKQDRITPQLLHWTSQKVVAFAVPVPIDGPVFDIVGTGGDHWDTFNVSSASSLILASMSIRVAKHGNRSQSGRIGSADFMEALGLDINLHDTKLLHNLKELGFAFLFGPKFHPAMKYAAPIRKEIGIRTLFNFLGPLISPARPTHMLVGVSVRALGPMYAHVLSLNSRVEHAWIVHSVSGMDEIGLDCETLVWEVRSGQISERTIRPEDFGLQRRPVEEVVAGKTARENVEIFHKILRNDPSVAAYIDWVCANCSLALYLHGTVKTLPEGVQMTRDTLSSSKALNYLQLLLSNQN